MTGVRTKPSLRFMWSHEASVHRFLVKVYNSLVSRLPFNLKYGFGQMLRSRHYPYRLVKPGFVVAQVGAPHDTLLAGRSRAMYFCLLAGREGEVYVVEPDSNSVDAFRKLADQRGLSNVQLFSSAAWSEKTDLTLYVDDAHPASNFSEGSKNYNAQRMRDYRTVVMPADSLDNLLSSKGCSKADLVSITTNGAEREILSGMKSLMEAGLPYVSLAITGQDYVEMMKEFGYELLAQDDRGYTFIQKNK